jgi:acetoin utilization deacetylase AcuC-like enzyme
MKPWKRRESDLSTLLFSHAACLDHDPGHGHPERPQRLTAVLKALEAPEFAALERRDAPMADPGLLTLGHPAHFVDRILGIIPPMGRAMIDGDTIVSPGSREAALRAAGAVFSAVDAVAAGEAKNAFCAVRPPGHHAEPDQAMGFCLFNNVAVAGLHARANHGLRRVAVIDFDVHHGNGTQAMYERDPDLFYASTHQWPLYPGTGSERERGIDGNVVNAPLPAGAGSAEFRRAFERKILPALDAFAPDILLISAGFDAHTDDPLASLNLVEADYEWSTAEMCKIAAKHARGRVVSALEGGYDLHALGVSAAAHVRALMAA